MSTTTPTPTPAADAVGSSSRSGLDIPARVLGPVTLATGAVLAAAGMALHLGAMPEDERLTQAIAEDPQWASSHVLLGLGFALVAIGIVSTLPLLRGRGSRFSAVGAVLASLGAVLMALSDIAHGALGLALRDQVDAATSLEIHLAYFEHPAILGLNLGPTLLPLGMILLGVGLLRSGTAPRWAGAVVLLTPVAVSASFALGLPSALQALPFLVGMLVLASALFRAPGQAADA